MGTLIQVRDVPEDVHRTLKARAAEEGVSLSELIRAELERMATVPTRAELRDRLKNRVPVPGRSSAEIIREIRGDIPE